MDKQELKELVDKEIKKRGIEHGRKGGKKTAERGSEYYRELQKKSVEKRKSNVDTSLVDKSID